MLRNSRSDQFLGGGAEPMESQKKLTKRYVLSQIAKLFDLQDLISPVIVLPKSTRHRVWADGLK